MIYDVVIIGGGPGGYTAALYCARAGLRTLVLEKLSPGGQMGTTDRIDNYPGFPEGINGFELAMQMKQGAERFGAETRMAEVKSVSLDTQPKRIETRKGTIEARAVILAAGAQPRELGLPNERMLLGRGISYCATCDGMFYKDQTVAVVGGGNTAIADVLYLAKICRKIYLIHRRDEFRASRVYLEPLKNTGNVEFVLNSEVTRIIGADKVTGVMVREKGTGNEREIAVDGLFIAVGNIPNSDLFREQVAVNDAGYILADETTQTNIGGVFAVGDIRAKPLRQIITAAADGAVASQFAEEYVTRISGEAGGESADSEDTLSFV